MSRLNTRIYVLPLVKGKEESYPVHNLTLIEIDKKNSTDNVETYCGNFTVESEEVSKRILSCKKISIIARDPDAGYSTIIHDIEITNTNDNRFIFATPKPNVMHINIAMISNNSEDFDTY